MGAGFSQTCHSGAMTKHYSAFLLAASHGLREGAKTLCECFTQQMTTTVSGICGIVVTDTFETQPSMCRPSKIDDQSEIMLLHLLKTLIL